ncbi:GIY-YIG nuclease family protein [Vibrio owensii]|uniref:GIY-YIG nuclease family protein n=1 Tax=Vibrio owensii TaxID=696485 RepID=UPI00339A377E
MLDKALHQNPITDKVQEIIDDSYEFKVKTLLAGITLKNHGSKWQQIQKEKANYAKLISYTPKGHFKLINRSKWHGVEQRYQSKVSELQAAHDEREAQKEIKRQMREEKARADALEKQQREAEQKERELRERQEAIEAALKEADEAHRAELEQQRAELEQEIEDTHKQYERAKSMAQLTKQGHVYVISNIGSFGENVFKVGMTRRLEPMDRVKELGDASVPFEFDVHAMISCDDAPALEKALHNELQGQQMNKVNPRKEFFKTDIDTIIGLVEKHHGQVEYVADPVALQYNQTLEIEAERQAA